MAKIKDGGPHSETSFFAVFRQFIIGLLMGIVFAFALDRCGVMYPAVIRSQFVFKNFAMLKMMLTAVAASSAILCIINIFVPTQFDELRRKRKFTDKGFLTLIFGGFIQGSAMAVSGACPGMMMGQVGAGMPDAPLIVVGGILGALTHAFFDDLITEYRIRDFNSTFKKWRVFNSLDQTLKRTYLEIAFPVLASMAAFVLFLEYMFDWTGDVSTVIGMRSANTGLISPSLAGAFLGLLQIPAIFLLNGSLLGTSQSYSIVVSQWLRLVPKELRPRYPYCMEQLNCNNYWQVSFSIGVLLGGAFSHYLSNTEATPRGVGPIFAFIGGFMLIFGARVSGGCASGHGISGLAALFVYGWTVVPAMFAGGIFASLMMVSIIGWDAFLLNV
jgi:hypothetical protein